MNADRFSEQAPLFVLGTLEADERTEFQEHAAGCAACQAEIEAYERVLAQLPLALEERQPRPHVREQLLAAVQPKARRSARGGWPLLLPLAAALLLGVLYWRANLDTGVERARAEELQARLAESQQRLAALELREAALRSMLANPETRITFLAGLKEGEASRARVFWNAGTTEAILTVAGLPTAPPGKAYQMWVIAGTAPVPAGVFQVAADGTAVFRLPRVAATRDVRTFAITIEPEQGVPAPTGPMVLAGQVT